jgi:hypothetical protein
MLAMYAVLINESSHYKMVLGSSTEMFAEFHEGLATEPGFTWQLCSNLEGLSPWQAPPPEQSATDILLHMRSLFSNQPLALQYEFRQAMAEVQAATEANNIALMRYIIERIDFTQSTLITSEQGEQIRTLFLGCFN